MIGLVVIVQCAMTVGQDATGISSDPTDQRSFATFLQLVEDDLQTTAPVNSAPSGNVAAPSDPMEDVSTIPSPETISVGAPQRQFAGEVPGQREADDANENQPLQLADVIASVYRSYPDIERARLMLPLAGGELLAAYGAYDTKLGAHSLSEPTGFYRNYRNGLGAARQTWWGGYLSAGYRIGRGFYQPWYKERQTNDGGEFKIGVEQPLLQGRAIDPQRVAVFQASLQQQMAGPQFQLALLTISRDAVQVFWHWVAAGAVLEAQQELLELAVRRGAQYDAGLAAGKFKEVDVILNQQLIAERRALRLKAEQKFRETGFKLGLFLRDDLGRPLIPDDGWLPKQFPTIQPQTPSDFNGDLAAAIGRRPEPQILMYEMRQIQLDRRLARNEMLPRFDFISEASQDVGERATKSNDKGEFELLIGFASEVPIQRRKALGKIQSTSAKINQTNEKLRLVRNKIAAELQIAYNALMLNQQIVEQSELSLRAAIDTSRRFRNGFEEGKIDLIYLNLLETKANESEIKLVESQRAWFAALGEFQLALGLDPLDQAMLISQLPPSDMPGPGNLPKPQAPKADMPEAE